MADAVQGLGAGSSLTDLVSTQKGGVQNVGLIAQSASALVTAVLSLQNAFPPATSSTSPVATGINNLGTTATTVIAANSSRHGIIFHNPSTGSVNVWVFPTAISTAPSLSALGGAVLLMPGGYSPFPPSQFPNMNAGFSAFASSGTTNPLTIWEFL